MTLERRPSAPPPLPRVDVTVPQWEIVTRAHRRLDTIRSAVGRVTTLAGAAAAAIGMFTDSLTGVSLLADAALLAGGLWTLRVWKTDGHQRAAATALYAGPGVSLAGLLLLSGPYWLEALGLGVWVTGTWVLRPARYARHMVAPPPPRLRPSLPIEQGPVDEHPVAAWWARKVAVDGGPAAGTFLDDIEWIGESVIRAVIRAAMPGTAVPDVNIRALSALTDVPEEQIAVKPIPGRGSGVRSLTIGAAAETRDPAAVWAQRIAPAAMPGAVLTGVRVGQPGGQGGQDS
ncbi:hypothetical protein GT755_12480 [Herbidospora sp. NEAU-GS84]|uniref:Uncharacterized protein n=1 Tax=Herbidospora solisilvae TaxID=2696284 RepID=A0A7C9JTP2_9ACTN|nr:hypothetical protein [Herbidospora solisilvae]NAS22499.1 hypothetical protein [Herbidospora solisilvae]